MYLKGVPFSNDLLVMKRFYKDENHPYLENLGKIFIDFCRDSKNIDSLVLITFNILFYS